MKNYILCEDISCRYYAQNKADLLEYITLNYKTGEYNSIENIKDLSVWSIKYDARKINVDDFFGDVIAIEKKTGESIDYDLYSKYGIKDKEEKKDFLYYNL